MKLRPLLATLTSLLVGAALFPAPHVGAATITYPDLQVQVPTSDISVGSSGGVRYLQFSHVTWNAGQGPFEIRPTYNANTGVSTFTQALYSMPSPGNWVFDHTVPVVKTGAWASPYYRFPLAGFGLYDTSGTGGGPGRPVVASPKTTFCITADQFVGGVPNTPAQTSPPVSNCDDPTKPLGFSVGWGDKYDLTDPGENIPLTGVADGTYWLRAQADPQHLMQQSDTSNDVTDTKVTISGSTATVVGAQQHPDSTPPATAVTAPTAGATVSGPTTLTATASGPSAVASVQFLLDGTAIGGPVTSSPYSVSYDFTGTPQGSHQIAAQATDVNGFIGTASPVQVTVSPAPPPPDTTPPTVSITNPSAGQTVSTTQAIAVNASDDTSVSSVQLYLDGTALGPLLTTAPYGYQWDTTTAPNGSHSLTAKATDSVGLQTTSSPVTVTVQNPPPQMMCFIMDVNTSVDGTGTVTTPAFHTGTASEQLLAFVSSDGPSSGGQQATVSGAGLTWTLVRRGNAALGDAEIWTARTSGVLSNATVKSVQRNGGYDQTLTVIAEQGVSGVGASASASASTGAPSATLTTTHPNSLVFGVGNDWDNPAARTLGPNQIMLHQRVDTAVGDTYWSQYTAGQAGPAGSRVTINDTAPTGDRWNLAIVELVGAAD